MKVKIIEAFPSEYYDEHNCHHYNNIDKTDWEECTDAEHKDLMQWVAWKNSQIPYWENRKFILVRQYIPALDELKVYKEQARKIEEEKAVKEKERLEKSRKRVETMAKKKEERERKKLVQLQDKYCV